MKLGKRESPWSRIDPTSLWFPALTKKRREAERGKEEMEERERERERERVVLVFETNMSLSLWKIKL